MRGVTHPPISRRAFQLLPAGLAAAVVVLVACGADPDTGAHPGQRLAKDYGCAACHSSNGDVGLGPTWKGLYGSQIPLQDGTTVTVDRDFLVRSIKDPAADVAVDNKLPMPVNNVPDADVQTIVDYIITLK
jgi:cytochrome c oxidase subunit II